MIEINDSRGGNQDSFKKPEDMVKIDLPLILELSN
jgi:hypothetical protein